jgi:hypothetical protein
VHGAVVTAVVIAASLVATAASGARGTLDQSTIPPGGYLSVVGASNAWNAALAQTFSAGVFGLPDPAAPAASPQSSASGRDRLDVPSTTAQGTSGGTVLALAVGG